MITITEDELIKLKRILNWARFQTCNNSVKPDVVAIIEMIKTKENECNINTKREGSI